MKKLKQGGEVRYLVQSHPVTKPRFEPRLFDSRVCSLNSTILLLIRILHIPYWKGASLLTNSIKSCAERKCLSSPLSGHVCAELCRVSSLCKIGKKNENHGKTVNTYDPKKSPTFYNSMRRSQKEEVCVGWNSVKLLCRGGSALSFEE